MVNGNKERIDNQKFCLAPGCRNDGRPREVGADEFRSINGQLQWIITEALRKNGRLKKSRQTPSEPPKE